MQRIKPADQIVEFTLPMMSVGRTRTHIVINGVHGDTYVREIDMIREIDVDGGEVRVQMRYPPYEPLTVTINDGEQTRLIDQINRIWGPMEIGDDTADEAAERRVSSLARMAAGK